VGAGSFTDSTVNIEKFGKALDDVAGAGLDTRWAGVFGPMIGWLDGTDEATDVTRDALENMGESFASMSTEGAQAALRSLRSEYDLTDEQILTLINNSGPYKDALIAQADKTGQLADDQTLLKIALTETAPTVLDAADAYLAAADEVDGGEDAIATSVSARDGVELDLHVSADARITDFGNLAELLSTLVRVPDPVLLPIHDLRALGVLAATGSVYSDNHGAFVTSIWLIITIGVKFASAILDPLGVLLLDREPLVLLLPLLLTGCFQCRNNSSIVGIGFRLISRNDDVATMLRDAVLDRSLGVLQRVREGQDHVLQRDHARVLRLGFFSHSVSPFCSVSPVHRSRWHHRTTQWQDDHRLHPPVSVSERLRLRVPRR